MWPPPPVEQALVQQQRADDQQRYAQGQVEPSAGVALGLDRIGVQHKHIEQPDCHTEPHPAQQEARKPHAGPLVPGQDQVNYEQFGFNPARAASPKNAAFIRAPGHGEFLRPSRMPAGQIVTPGSAVTFSAPEHHPSCDMCRCHDQQ